MRYSQRAHAKWSAIGLLTLFAVAAGDYSTGEELAFGLFYLVPVGLVTWYGSRQLGLAFAGLAAIAWHAVDAATNTYSAPGVAYWNALIRFGFFVTVAYLLYERTLARVDPLTGVANRRRFFEILTVELSRSQRYHRNLSIAYIDIDAFKRVNDERGHYVGDQLLCCVADCLSNKLRNSDHLARIGGDEFTVIMPETDRSASELLIARLRSHLRDTTLKHGWRVGFSIGIVTYGGHSEVSVDRLVACADAMMYRAKRDTLNIVCHECLT